MQNHSRLHTLGCLIAAFVFSISGCAETRPFPTHDDIMGCVVEVVTVGARNELTGLGTAIVVANMGEESLILTARHVAFSHVCPECTPGVTEIGERRSDIDVMIQQSDMTYVRQDSTFLWDNPELDLAVFETKLVNRPSATFLTRDPVWSERAFSVGRYRDFQFLTFHEGYFQGRQGNRLLFSTHVNSGFSGGAVFVFDGGVWKVAGVISQQGMVQNNLLHHFLIAIPSVDFLDSIKAPPPPVAVEPLTRVLERL